IQDRFSGTAEALGIPAETLEALSAHLAQWNIDYSDIHGDPSLDVSEALVEEYINGGIDLDGLGERYMNSSVEAREGIVSTLLDRWRDSHDSAVLKRALVQFNDEILEAYEGGRLTDSARAVVDVQMEAIRRADLFYHVMEPDAPAMDLFLTPARARLLMDSFEPRNARVENHRPGSDPVLENLDEPWRVEHYSLSDHGSQAFIERFRDTQESAVRFDPQAHSDLNRQLVEWCRRGENLPGDAAQPYTRLNQALNGGAAFNDLSGQSSDPYVTVLRHPESGKLMAVVLYSDRGSLLHENFVDDTSRSVCIEGVVMPPPGDSPAEQVPVNIRREALIAAVAQINRRFPGRRISLWVNSAAEEIQARALFFNRYWDDIFLVSNSGSPTDFDASSTSLFRRRMVVLEQSIAQLEAIVEGEASSPQTREALQNLREGFQGLRTRMAEDPAFWAGEGDAYTRRQVEELALRIYSEDPARFRAHAGPGLETCRVAAAGRLSEGRSFFYTRILNELPESFQAAYRNRPASDEAIGALIGRMAQELSPEEFADALGPAVAYLRENQLFQPTAASFERVWRQGLEQWPDHARAVEARHPEVNEMVFRPEPLFYNHTRYDSQWIIGLNSERGIVGSIEDLASKNPESSRVSRWDGFRLIEHGGRPVELGADGRLVIVAHGTSQGIRVDHPRWGVVSYSGRNFAEFLMEQNILAPGSRIARISFTSCILGGEMPVEDTGVVTEGFAHDFMEEMARLGVTVDSISLRNGYSVVDKFGRKWVANLQEDGTVTWHHKGGRKVVISRNEDGELVYRRGNMDEGIAPIDGANPEDLPDGERRHFADGIQTDALGRPLEEGDTGRLTDDQLAVIRARYGE
ncbi:MAG: hypothetical protein MI749_01895, partial [Desulfovibrionales bacterium]|nr:hypothetical protein [Desulfovibrionales bacterium]